MGLIRVMQTLKKRGHLLRAVANPVYDVLLQRQQDLVDYSFYFLTPVSPS